MTSWQKILKYVVMAFACFLCFSVIGSMLGALGIFSSFFGLKNNAVGQMSTYPIMGNIASVSIDTGASEVAIRCSDDFRIETNNENIVIKENGGNLRITEKSSFVFGIMNNANTKVNIYVPYDSIFDSFDLDSGAGIVDVEKIAADRIEMDLGAGDVRIGEMTAGTKAKIDGGTGKITIDNCRLSNADMNIGVGEMNLTGELIGRSDVEIGIGSARMNLTGDKEQYHINVDKGIGSVIIDGQKMSDDSVYGNGINRIDLDGGIGTIRVDFK